MSFDREVTDIPEAGKRHTQGSHGKGSSELDDGMAGEEISVSAWGPEFGSPAPICNEKIPGQGTGLGVGSGR